VQYADSTFLRLLAESKPDVFDTYFKHEQGCDISSHNTLAPKSFTQFKKVNESFLESQKFQDLEFPGS
jgi:hypothetical protein